MLDIMGKTADGYYEGDQNIANKGFRIACDETFPSLKLFCYK